MRAGDSADATLTVAITDDVPVAVADADLNVTEGDGDTVGVNLLANDDEGADGAVVTHLTYTDDLGVVQSDVAVPANAGTPLVVQTQTGQLTVGSDGAWSFDPINSMDHSGADPVVESFDYTITDGDSDPSTATQLINVADDTPTAENDTNQVAPVQGLPSGTNLVIIFDRSGSMNSSPDFEDFQARIDLAKAAVANLIAAYEDQGGVDVLVIDFSSSAASSGWTSATGANAYLAGLEASGTTNYDAAKVTDYTNTCITQVQSTSNQAAAMRPIVSQASLLL